MAKEVSFATAVSFTTAISSSFSSSTIYSVLAPLSVESSTLSSGKFVVSVIFSIVFVIFPHYFVRSFSLYKGTFIAVKGQS